MLNNLLSKLRQKTYRNAYVKAHLAQGLAYQICALRQQRGWSQKDLAEKLSLKNQSAVARMEDPSYGKLSIATLLKLASAFDVALSIRFQSYSKFLEDRNDLTSASLEARSFDDDQFESVWAKHVAGLGSAERISDISWRYASSLTSPAANHPNISAATVTRFPKCEISADDLALAS